MATFEEDIARTKANAVKYRWSPAALAREIKEVHRRHNRPFGALERTSTYSDRNSSSSSKSSSTAPERRDPLNENHAQAPYRFIEVLDAVVFAEPEVQSRIDDVEKGIHLNPLPDGIEGKMRLEWRCETPLLIGWTNKKANRSPSEVEVSEPLPAGEGSKDFWVPGASLRGMLKSVCEVLAFSRLSQINRDDVFSLRHFQHPFYTDADGNGSPVTKSEKLSMGWLRWVGNDPTTGAPLFQFVRSEFWHVPIDDIAKLGWTVKEAATNPKNPHTPLWRQSWVETDVFKKYAAAGMIDGDHLKFEKKLRFRASGLRDYGRAVANIAASGEIEGYLVFGNKTPAKKDKFNLKEAKKYEYVLTSSPPTDDALWVDIAKKTAFNFWMANSSPAGKGRVLTGAYKQLEKTLRAGKPVPFFFVGNIAEQGDKEDRQAAFGLTRTFKIPHRFTVGEFVDRQQAHRQLNVRRNSRQIDMVDALFGYVDLTDNGKTDDGQDALQGRVSFSGGRISAAQRPVVSKDISKTVMMAARASFAPFYLRGIVKDWSDDSARVAGRKTFLPRAPQGGSSGELDDIKARIRRQNEASNDNEAAKSHFKTLFGEGNKPLEFSSEIDLHNVTKVELGLLLYALRLGCEPRLRFLLGRGKPFGMGQLQLKNIDLSRIKTIDGENVDERECIQAFFHYMRSAPETLQCAGGDGAQLKSFPDIGPVKELFASHDPVIGANIPGPTVQTNTNGAPPSPTTDMYLRLSYKNNDGNGSYKPYEGLKKATMLLPEKVERPVGQPDRLLPVLKK
jgi:CRISPR-associated protein (TIGR03986 family)